MIVELQSNKRPDIYNMLTHFIISHTMLLVRRRPVDFKLAKLRHFGLIDTHDELLEMTKSNLNPTDIQTCKKFDIFYVPGKNLDIVPIVLTQLMRTVLEELIKHRPHMNIKSDTLFVLSDDKPIEPTYSLSLLKRQVKLFNPRHLTGNRLRHQAATFSRLHSDHPQYQDLLASVLGHSLHVHKKNYQLPVGILQKLMVCPILHSIVKGRRHKDESKHEQLPIETETTNISNQEKNLQSTDLIENNINQHVEDNLHSNSLSDYCNTNPTKKKTKWTTEEQESPSDYCYTTPIKKITKWTTEEQEMVLHHFSTILIY